MAADLETFLQEEVGALNADEEEDEYADVDWCDPGEVEEPGLQEEEEAAEPAAEPRGRVAEQPGGPPKPTKEEAEEAKRLRRQAVLQHRTLSLCCVARLAWLNRMCNQDLLQAALLSLAPDCLKAGVGQALQNLKATLRASDSPAQRGTQEVQPSLVRLLRALHSSPKDLGAEEWVLLLVARCRAEGRASRLAMRLPLPPAKSCLGLLRNPGEESEV
ncbi:mus210 [Symbiodinium natans]|uniref:Mus210 protein n=1 Tax=Symbiodinium natans TaxID=878477 RepID=A0A812H4D7_9DINO|nr:mus210 [Symbiodinium natans]